MAIGIVIAVLVVGFGFTIYRFRSGGPGPAMNWMPKSMRGKANDTYQKHGWQKPFDEQGDRNPDRSAL